MKSNDCHLVRELLDLARENELRLEEKSLVEEHLSCCPDCQNAYQKGLTFSNYLREVFDLLQPSEILGRKIIMQIRKRQRQLVYTYAASAAVLLIGIGLIFILLRTMPTSSDPFLAELSQKIILSDGSYLLTTPDTQYEINELKKEVILTKGTLLLDRNNQPGVIYIITPVNILIRQGKDFLIDTSNNNWIVSVSGSVELSTVY